MAQGIIQVSPSAIKDFIDLTIDPALIDLGKLKEVLLLPDRYTVEQVRHREFCILNGYVEVIVSSPDIPEVEDGKALPSVTPWYSCDYTEDYKAKAWFLLDLKINDASAIREEDKQHKFMVEVKDVINVRRDMQFQGFAKLLMRDLDAVSTTTYASLDKAREAYALVVARRAYDFVKHALRESDVWHAKGLDAAVQSIPDLIEWPGEAEYPGAMP